jgi:brevianamide F synthase
VETKVYRTGDIAKYDTDGSIIYLHRKDSQVKLRGQRFELSEVEHHVQRNFPGPTNVVAEVVERQRQRTLFAFILSNEDNAREATAGDSDSRLFHGATEAFTVAVTAVEAQIRQSLPNFMIPATFIPLVRMPYTTSGKTDRHRLWDEAAALSSHQLLTYRRRNAAGQSRTPSTQAERALQAIWADVLGLPASNTKADDTFFNLRGDSIIAIKVASFARATGLHITVADIFDHPPLCDLAEFGLQNSLKGAREVTPFSLSLIQYPEQYLHQLKLLGLTPGSSEIIDLLPGTHIQNFFNQRQTLHYYTFQLAGDVDEQRLQAATAAVMDGKAQHSPYHVYRPSGRSASSDLARAPNSVSAYLWHQRPCRLQPGIVGSRSDGE